MRWHNSDWLQEQASDHLITSYEADRNRQRMITWYLMAVMTATIVVPFFYLINYMAFSVMFLFLGLYSVLGMVVFGVLLRRVRLSSRYWRQVPGGVELRASAVFSVLEAASMVLAAVGMVVTIWVAMFVLHASGHSGRYSAVGTAFTMLSLLAHEWNVREPRDLPGRMVITLTPDGMRIFQGDENLFVPWQLSPHLRGVMLRNGVAFIAVKSGNVPPIAVRMRLAPISYSRFEHLISFYVSRPELRQELSTEAGLERVKYLMHRHYW